MLMVSNISRGCKIVLTVTGKFVMLLASNISGGCKIVLMVTGTFCNATGQ